MNLSDLIFGKRKDPVSLAIEEAINHMEAGDHAAAIAAIRDKALPLAPDHRRARLHLGIALMLKGDLGEAEKELSAVAGPDRRWSDSEGAAALVALDRIVSLRAGGK
ncbi:MAG: tetratricopeptide repeat protein [Planctomycetota bacterium]|jgi:Flp pilus assembly protein TadD|nr:tetratricopeptide repeat protein [Planctomycetota bacterium]